MINDSIDMGMEDFTSDTILQTVRMERATNAYISNSERINNVKYYNFGLTIPRFIFDEGANPTLKYISMENIFSCYVEKLNNKILLKCPSTDEISESYLEQKQLMISRVENVLMSAIGERIAKLAKVQTGLNPIIELLNSLYVLQEIPISDFQKRRKYKKNTEKYLKFLKSENYIVIQDEIIYPGSKLEGYDISGHNKEFSDSILTDVILHGYDYIKQFLQINILTPYLELSGAYYLQAHFAERMIGLNHFQLSDYYYDMYPEAPKKQPYQIYYNLQELHKAEILTQQDNVFSGADDIYSSFESNFGFEY